MDRQARLKRAPAALASALVAACAAGPYGLRVEQRPAEDIVRISNSARLPAVLHYNHHEPFGDHQMFHVRFRDAEGRILPLGRRGWWSPLALSSTLHAVDQPMPRRTLTIPARGHLDVPRDIRALQRGLHVREAASGPCAVQLMLIAYRGVLAGQSPIKVVSEWQPSDCPAPYVAPR